MKVYAGEKKKSRNVKNGSSLSGSEALTFSFSNFRFTPINIDDVFNNHYKDETEYVRKISTLIGKALPLLSKESSSLFSDISKITKLHLHKILNKQELLFEILQKYGFSNQFIDDLLEGAEIYQFEVPYENGATRIVFQKIDNLISFLFMDPNHHIYLNSEKTNRSGSMFYEYCPVYLNAQCYRMDYLKTCLAFDYLDQERLDTTFGYDYSPNDK